MAMHSTGGSGTGPTLADLGEFGLISALAGKLDAPAHVLIGPGDDAALVAAPGGRILISTDLLIENRHFRRDWSSANDVGHKAAAANLADIAAMGGTATSLTVGFAAPGDLDAQWAIDMSAGFGEECQRVGAVVVGGDVTAADQIMIAVTVLGSCGGEPVRRSGARPGDVVAIAGRIGWAAAGFHVLTRGFRSPRAVVEAHRRPDPDYAAGPRAAAAGARALIDVSDGLLAELGHIASASGVSIDVHSAAFEIAEPLQAVGAALGMDPLSFILTGGDDHTMLATFPNGATLPEEFRQIGAVAEPVGGTEGPAVTVDGAPYEGETGHAHFR